MEQIQSAKNAFIKKVRSLEQKECRDETGLFLAEGDKCAKEALQAGRAEALLTTKEDHQLAIQAEREGDPHGVRAAVGDGNSMRDQISPGSAGSGKKERTVAAAGGAVCGAGKCLGSPECRDDSAHSGCGGGGGCAAFRAVRGLYFPKGGTSRHGQHFSFAYPNDE